MTETLPKSWLGWMVLPLRRYVRLSGRSGRSEFWFYCLFLFLGYAAMFTVAVAAGLAKGDVDDDSISVMVAGWALFFLANFLPGLALTVRRLHDMGLSGALLVVILLLVGVLGPFGFFGYFAWMSVPGQKSANRHGMPVYHQDVSEVFS
jgi:uncharacterized membrane protein YhaH (DUF805 family)